MSEISYAEFNKLLPSNKMLPKCFAIDLSDNEMLEIEAEWCNLKVSDIDKIQSFKSKHPTFVWSAPYEGFVLWLFSKRGEITKISHDRMYHRGGGAKVGNLLVSLDLD